MVDIIVRLCDACRANGENHEAHRYEISITQDPGMTEAITQRTTVDLCDDVAAKAFGLAHAVMNEFGHPVLPGMPSKPRNGKKYWCDPCGEGWSYKTGKDKHDQRLHGGKPAQVIDQLRPDTAGLLQLAPVKNDKAEPEPEEPQPAEELPYPVPATEDSDDEDVLKISADEDGRLHCPVRACEHSNIVPKDLQAHIARQARTDRAHKKLAGKKVRKIRPPARPHKCPVCSEMKAAGQGTAAHVRSRHKDVDRKTLRMCDDCPESFIGTDSAKQLKEHGKEHAEAVAA